MDDRRLRAIVRSVIVLAVAAPAGTMFACGALLPELDPPTSDGGEPGREAIDGAPVPADASLPIIDASGPDRRLPPAERCMTYAPLPLGFGRGADGGDVDFAYDAGVCNTHCVPPADLADAATPPTICWGLDDPTFGQILGCAYPNGPASQCGCAPASSSRDVFGFSLDEPVPCGVYVATRNPLDPRAVCIRVCPPVSDLVDAGIVNGLSDCSEVSDAGALTVRCTYSQFAIGRRAEGAVEVSRARGSVLGAFLANASHLEAASVFAFTRLRDELVSHGAPRELVDRAMRAREDEVRHGAITAALARRFGAEDGEWAEEPRFVDVPARSLEAIAIENAVEGCVHETWSAVLNLWEAEHATDRTIRRAFAVIAEDELRHAALAWSVHEWVIGHLDAPAQARVAAAKDAAVSAFTVPLHDPARELLEEAGVPDCASVARLLAGMKDALWSASA